MPLVTYRAYRRTAWRAGDALVVHGRYDGLATAAVAHVHGQLFVPLAGRAHVAPARGPGLVIGPEAAIWLPAGLAHATNSLGAAVAFVALNVPAGWLAANAEAIGLGPPPAGPLVLREPALWLVARLLADTLAEPPGGDAWVQTAMRQLGALAARAAARPAEDAGGPTGVTRAVDRVMRDYAAPLTVAGLAAEAGLGVRQFERRFAQAAGQPPRRFLIAVRLAAARERLATTDAAVEAIAAAVGFADATHLARAFRAAHGTTPAAWRRARAADRQPAEPAPNAILNSGLPEP